MRSPRQGIFTGAMIFVVTLVGAAFGYILFGCPPLDAIYMVVITIFGIGYGEFCPVSPLQRVFTMLVIIAGVVSAAFIVGGIVQMVTEGELHRALDSRKKTRDIEQLQGHTIICGFGRIGLILARRLEAEQESFVIVDNNSERILGAEEMGFRVYQGNATDEDVLQAVGIQRARVLATVLPDDAINVFITLTARGLNPNLMIVARGELPSTEKKLRLAGADHVVSPATISGQMMSNLITHPNMVEFLSQNDEQARLNELLAQIQVQVDELKIPHDSPMVGKTIGDLEVRGKGTFIVVALRKRGGDIMLHPGYATKLDQGDTVIVLGHRGDIPKFTRLFEVKKQLRYRGAKT
ncbi:MAG: potassium channel protein [Oculatellaceae cyanobacterium Prado106]|nr:potassium channel protein [Oculatellaceae cyanobacterium Prado106]